MRASSYALSAKDSGWIIATDSLELLVCAEKSMAIQITRTADKALRRDMMSDSESCFDQEEMRQASGHARLIAAIMTRSYAGLRG
jgi:hypothetical protein